MIDPLWILRTVVEAQLFPWVCILVVVLLAFLIGWVRWKMQRKSEKSGGG